MMTKKKKEKEKASPGRPKPDGDDYKSLPPIVHPVAEALLADRGVVLLNYLATYPAHPIWACVTVKGFSGLRKLAEKLDVVQRKLDGEVRMQLEVAWDRRGWPEANEDDFASVEEQYPCDFDAYPDWIMLRLTVEGARREGLLKKQFALFADAYREAGRTRNTWESLGGTPGR